MRVQLLSLYCRTVLAANALQITASTLSSFRMSYLCFAQLLPTSPAAQDTCLPGLSASVLLKELRCGNDGGFDSAGAVKLGKAAGNQ